MSFVNHAVKDPVVSGNRNQVPKSVKLNMAIEHKLKIDRESLGAAKDSKAGTNTADKGHVGPQRKAGTNTACKGHIGPQRKLQGKGSAVNSVGKMQEKGRNCANRFECDEKIADSLINNRGERMKFNCAEIAHNNLCAEVPVVFKKGCFDPEAQQFISLNNDQLSTDKKPCILFLANNNLLKAIVDSGSDRTIIKHERLRKFDPRSHLNPSTCKVRGLNGVSEVAGEVEFSMRSSEKMDTNRVAVSARVKKKIEF